MPVIRINIDLNAYAPSTKARIVSFIKTPSTFGQFLNLWLYASVTYNFFARGVATRWWGDVILPALVNLRDHIALLGSLLAAVGATMVGRSGDVMALLIVAGWYCASVVGMVAVAVLVYIMCAGWGLAIHDLWRRADRLVRGLGAWWLGGWSLG